MSAPSARRYHDWRLLCFFLGLALHFLLLGGLVLTGLSEIFWRFSAGAPPGAWRDGAYFALIFSYLSVGSTPLDMASGYFLEKRFGLSRQSAGAWLADHLKKNALSLGLFLLTASCFFGAIRTWPSQGWWVLGLGWFLLAGTLTTVFPVCVVPLFYPTRPLGDAALKKDLLEWCRLLRMPVLDIYEIAFSKKTTKANAALVGFGKTRRVLLADTLLRHFTPEEIKMVLSHEIGHQVRRHLLKGLFWEFVLTLSGFWTLFRLSDAVAKMAGVPALSDARALPFLLLLAFAASLGVLPLRNGLSRHYEREADRYAWTVFPSAETFVSLMRKLAEQNLTVEAPPRWEEILLHDHPSVERRIGAAGRFFERVLAK
jgi:STE24 endopeptidase